MVKETVLVPLVYVLAIRPEVRLTELPVNVHPLAIIVIEAKRVPFVKSLFAVGLVVHPAKSNTKTSPAKGAVSVSQLAAVVQLLSPPPPSQVRVAANAGCKKSATLSVGTVIATRIGKMILCKR
jgi:hypothetical protein